jgi:hypothetical protein
MTQQLNPREEALMLISQWQREAVEQVCLKMAAEQLGTLFDTSNEAAE